MANIDIIMPESRRVGMLERYYAQEIKAIQEPTNIDELKNNANEILAGYNWKKMLQYGASLLKFGNK